MNFLKAMRDILVDQFGDKVTKLTEGEQRMVLNHFFETKVERTKRKQVHMLCVNLEEGGVAEEITTSETRWIRKLAKYEDGIIDDFVIVKFDKTGETGMNFFALSRGLTITKVKSTDPKAEAIWLERVKGKVFKLFLQSASQARTASGTFMVDNGTGYAKQWEDAIRKITYGWFPKKPMPVAKFLSATGLAQSSTQLAVANAKFRVVDDFTADRGFGEFIYTDGEGYMSEEMAEEIATVLQLNYVPSAFQVRIGCIKGLLTKKKGLDTDVVVTKSMVKMLPEGIDELPIEICLVSKKVPEMNPFTYQFIQATAIKAEDLKVLVDRHMEMMNGILNDADKAMKYFGMIGDDEAKYDELTQRSKIMRALDANPASLFDPWVQSKIKQTMERSLKDDARGRIPVRGGYYFGASEPVVILKGSPLLERGQAYLNGRTGKVGIFRTPCIHQSEPCTLELVNSPELMAEYGDLKDVLILNVFDYTLYRLGGADCDGDKFFVTDEEPIVNAIENYPESLIVWSDPKEKPTPIDITWEKVIEHVFKKAKMSMIGHVTDLGTTYLDKFRTAVTEEERMYYDKLVRQIRDIQGQLIDSAKKDYDVNIPKELETLERPHWLRRSSERIKYYHSDSPMGFLYDYVHLVHDEFMKNNLGASYYLTVNLLQQVDQTSFNMIEGIVSTYHRGYNTDVQYVLMSNGAIDEEGHTMDRVDLPQDKKDAINAQLKNVAEKYQGLLDTLTAITDPETIAICAYFVAYQKASNGRGYSFPWACCADGLISALSRVAQDRFMLMPIKAKKGIDIPDKVEVENGLLFADDKFIGISKLSSGTYEVTKHNNMWYAKVPRTHQITADTNPNNTYQFTLVGIVPEVIQYLQTQVGKEITLYAYQEPVEGVDILSYGLFYNGYKLGKVARSSTLPASMIVNRPVKVLSVTPSKKGKSVDIYVEA